MRIHELEDPFDQSEKIKDTFIKWWGAHQKSGPKKANAFSDQMFHNRINVVFRNGVPELDCAWKIDVIDPVATRLPVKFGTVSQMRLVMPKLETLEGAPKNCNLFSLEGGDTGAVNNVLTSIVGCPERAEHLAFTLARPLKNLINNLQGPIDSIHIHAPSIESFEGIAVHCNTLTCNIPFQKSISGIHKQLRNVEQLFLVLDPNFDGGLLGLGMCKGLKRVVGLSSIVGRPTKMQEQAFAIISSGLAQGRNIHEMQEEMIEAGLGKFARL